MAFEDEFRKMDSGDSYGYGPLQSPPNHEYGGHEKNNLHFQSFFCNIF